MSGDDKFYEQALNELENDTKIKSTWARAYANSEDEDSAKRLYIRNRVEQLQGEQVDELQADKKSSELEVSQDASEAKKPPKKKVDTSAKDKLPMEPMAGTYKAIFLGSLGIAILLFLANVAVGTNNHLPVFFWLATAWYMYKRDLNTSILLQKILIGLALLSGAIGIYPYASADSMTLNIMGVSPQGLLIGAFVSFGAHCWLLKFFQREYGVQLGVTNASDDFQSNERDHDSEDEEFDTDKDKKSPIKQSSIGLLLAGGLSSLLLIMVLKGETGLVIGAKNDLNAAASNPLTTSGSASSRLPVKQQSIKSEKFGWIWFEGNKTTKTGEGKYRWTNGDIYDGDWVNGKQSGRGKQTWATGEIYVGGWKDGEQHGRGVLMSAGRVKTGFWINKNYYESVVEIAYAAIAAKEAGDNDTAVQFKALYLSLTETDND